MVFGKTPQQNNRYGRYLSNSSIGLIFGDDIKSSGLVQKGFDWNRIDGATVIYLPLNKLKNKGRTEILKNNRYFVDGCKITALPLSKNPFFSKAHWLIMLTRTGENYKLTVSDPDLNFKKQGRFGITSKRPVMHLKLQGKWKLKSAGEDVSILKSDAKNTILKINCHDGLSNDIILSQVK